MKVPTVLFTYIQGRFANAQTARIMEEHPSERFVICSTAAAADVIVWTGGEDIDPSIYNSKLIQGTHINRIRDMEDLDAVRMSVRKIKIGICRGAQLLNCNPNGGSLWQDVDGHENGHHTIKDYITGNTHTVNSIHHQMMRPTDKAVVVAGNDISKEKHGYEGVWKRENSKGVDVDRIDPEVVWYPDTKSLLFQGHPEFSHPETTRYFYNLIDRYVLDAA